ncbi:protein hu-li tai shao [Trichonephila inaurata madagascariensis]|uniref:Protein hu-li tai shao n=1 Tax=Trichonephila inaurata madagascariensis TaxID=2747483 RepID=A0A8X6YSD3_9ARAC|nr:protein hu-li tai shao [Trichonephila inaurata madagascariensis]
MGGYKGRLHKNWETTSMAEVETNGTMEANGPVTEYDPEDQKQMWRPPDINQDLREMERRKRVDMIMNSQVFREELERIIESQINEGSLPANLAALQQVTELLLPNRRSSNIRAGHCVIPINDIRGVDAVRYTKYEKILRLKLAAVYRLIDLYGWSENIYNHITVRVSQDLEHFLLNPFGLQYPEVTASSLIKVDMQGNVIDPGSTSFTFNRAGFVLHSAVHAARPDVRCCIHIHHPPCVAVSAMKCGLLKISQESALIGDVSYHDYNGIVVDTAEKEEIARDLGPVNKVMILRNHGVLICASSIEEALFYLQNFVSACETQVRLMPIGLDNIQIMSQDASQKVRNIITMNHANVTGKPDADEKDQKFHLGKIWDLEFEAQMRMLDNAGFRTGYLYRYPLIRVEQPRQKNDVEVPPAATSFAQYLEEDKWLRPLKKLMEGKQSREKLRWVNSPNVYQKVEVLETGTSDPKKITKWVQEGSPSHTTLVKIESPHQFVPKTGDPNEFKKKQKEMKQNRMHSKITAGPQSSILEGVTWEEIKKMQDAQLNASGDQVVLMGAASKGIIQRQFQNNAMVYKTAYAKNPFDGISDEDLQEYYKIVERKQRGEPIEDEIPEHLKPLLYEPIDRVADEQVNSVVQDLNTPPASPCSEEEASKSGGSVQRSMSARLSVEAAEEIREKSFQRRTLSERKPKSKITGDVTLNGEEKLKSAESGEVSAASRSSKESSPVKEVGDESPKKDKKKKKGLRTPSFLKKKKHKKEKEDKEKVAS